MDKTTLVKEQIDGGARLVRRLRERGVEVPGALWARTAYDGKPYLYIITPEVDALGTIEAHGKVQDALQSLLDDSIPWEEQIDRFSIKLLSPSEKLAQGVLRRFTFFPNDPPAWHHDTTIGSAYVEGAYIYPAKLFTPPPAAVS